MLEDPFEATDVLVFADVLARAPRAPVTALLGPLFEALLESPAKATASGYLPPGLCATIERRVYEEHGVLPFERQRPKVTSESAFMSLHVARLVATFAGLMRKHRGTFQLTRKGRASFERHGLAGVYPALLRTYATRLEWSSLDGFPRVPIVQASFAFALVLLVRFGHSTRPATFYVERWLRAFPGIEDVFEPLVPVTTAGRSRVDARGQFEHCFRGRVLERFFAYFGLAEVRAEPRGRSVSVRATPLLHDVVALRHGG